MTQRALVVYEDRDVTDLISATLAMRDFAVSAHTDAAEALAEHRAHPVDVVVTDLHMPGLDGRELIDRLEPTQGGPVVIVVTAERRVQLLDDARRAGAGAVVLKPFEPDGWSVWSSGCSRMSGGVPSPAISMKT